MLSSERTGVGVSQGMSDQMVQGRLQEGGGISAGWEHLKAAWEEGHTDEAAGGVMLARGSARSPEGLACPGHSLGLAGMIGSQGVV